VTNVTPFTDARDLLLGHPTDYLHVRSRFRWPILDEFNWALDVFDPMAAGNHQMALGFADPNGIGLSRSFDQMSRRSNQVANLLRDRGVKRGDRLLLMLPNSIALWETILAAIKVGAVIIPAAPQLTRPDLEDRFARGDARHVVTDRDGYGKVGALGEGGVRLLVDGDAPGWLGFSIADGASPAFEPAGVTRATDPLLLYFTSGTTAKPKLVLHTHASYPIGHLVTMYWLGVRPGDRHLNISSPGWAKHAYSSLFAPWNAGASIVVFAPPRPDPKTVLETIAAAEVTTFCGPPTLWRMLINEDLAACPHRLRELLSAGEPLNPEVIDRVRAAWDLTIREGYGQTETTLLVGSFPGQIIKPGSMGLPAPGYSIALRPPPGSPTDQAETEGELTVGLDPVPVGLMVGYLDDPSKMATARAEGFYRTGDVATVDADGYFTYVGRSDDVFKSAGYRLSPFELESVLIEHPAIAEAAVTESPDPVRGLVPKAFVALRAGHQADRNLALDVLRFVRGRVPPYKRIRRLEFAELPKTISGKIRRVELRLAERRRAADPVPNPMAFTEEDFPELRAGDRA
jgi:acetyl-CoA synthetase